MFFGKRKFHEFLSTHEVVEHQVYGSEYSICIPEGDLTDASFGIVIAKLLQEGKAVRENGNLYVDPYYDSYAENRWSILQKKLLAKVKQDKFKALLNQSELVVKKEDEKAKNKFFYRIGQNDIKRFNCIMTIAELVNKGLAHVEDDQEHTVYLELDYLSNLETKRMIQSDLSHFRTMLGECDNLRNIIELIEESKYKDGKIYLEVETIKNKQLNTEIYSLCDLGIVTAEDMAEDGETTGFLMEPEFASWLLACIEETSDRISYVNMYGE